MFKIYIEAASQEREFKNIMHSWFGMIADAQGDNTKAVSFALSQKDKIMKLIKSNNPTINKLIARSQKSFGNKERTLYRGLKLKEIPKIGEIFKFSVESWSYHLDTAKDYALYGKHIIFVKKFKKENVIACDQQYDKYYYMNDESEFIMMPCNGRVKNIMKDKDENFSITFNIIELE